MFSYFSGCERSRKSLILFDLYSRSAVLQTQNSGVENAQNTKFKPSLKLRIKELVTAAY
jgi:hypothetical protein